MEWLLVALTLVLLGFGLGLWVGMRQTAEAVETERERMSRVLDVPSRAGEAHNYLATPARVSQGKVRNRRRWKNVHN